MARPHLEFIQSQTLPWRGLDEETARPGAESKGLSFDADTDAATVILRYPPGWHMDRPHYLECDEELYVLAGGFSIGATTYNTGDYAYLPAGLPRESMASAAGATVLTFFEGPHRSIFGVSPSGLYDATKLIHRATATMPWEGCGDATLQAIANSAGRRSLRDDPITGEQTWILTLGPDDQSVMTTGRTETHPVVEETFVLGGDVAMHCGLLKPGAYFWRPPGISHGPVATPSGFLGFFRCKGGPLSTVWSEGNPLPINWNPPYNPVLPENVRALAFENYDPAMTY